MEIYNKVYGGLGEWVKYVLPLYLFTLLPLSARAQVGEYRTDFAVGVNGGYMMSNVGFIPEVPQGWLGGLTGGLTLRYTSEKYFKSICAIVAEVNLAQTGWKENIENADRQSVPRHDDPNTMLAYSRKMTYLQIPVFARMGWGRERKGFQFFFQVGPQIGLFLSEKTDATFDVRQTEFNPGPLDKPNAAYRYRGSRVSHVVAQDSMAVEKKLDYGIAGGIGLEFSHPKVGHFLIEGRYYYGLGDIYGNSKSDYFGRSNFGPIVIKATYLFDLVRTKNDKIK